MMSDSTARTPLYDWHVARPARMVEFGGWMMPVQYTSIVDEHQATRKAAGVFDISHMGRLRFDGAGAESFLDQLLTRRVAGMGIGKIRYSLVTHEAGGILDDVLVYRLSENDQPFFLLVVNASNRVKIVDWINRHLDRGKNVQFTDQTLETAMIAVQGPAALECVSSLVDADLTKLDYYTGLTTRVLGHDAIASRTGYTGEDGCELIVRRTAAVEVWTTILERGEGAGVKPAGLGARDTLRLEAAMPLYGHELSESINPFQAGLGFAVNLNHSFIGRDALAHFKETAQPVRVGLELAGKRVPREHYRVLRDGQEVGEITSGTFSPTLEKPIAMAYVRPESSAVGVELMVDIRGKPDAARVVPLPFYKRPSL